jgi:MoaA/NifB/PqqE/SkfB family radical SAM enzyme
MVCRRCIMTVTDIFRKESILPLKVELGMVTLAAPLSPEQFQRIREQLEAVGFEVIDDRRMRMVEQIRLDRVCARSGFAGPAEPVRIFAGQVSPRI